MYRKQFFIIEKIMASFLLMKVLYNFLHDNFIFSGVP